ncbi:ABC-2 family transporter protein [Candidatus Woesearchaeota archaeon]|nr:ABC-2 family transporter protein [Candidatus Woesearchaeota archaeon]
MKYPKLARAMFAIRLSNAFAYKANFIAICLAKIIGDLVGPLVAIFIYANTQGIPGWSFEQFLLFQGTFIIIMGLTTNIAIDIFWNVHIAVEFGNLDKYLLKPYNSWLYLLSISVNWEGLAEILLGTALVTYSAIKLNIPLSINIFLYFILIFTALVFMTSIYTLISAGSIIAVKNEALNNLFQRFLDFARYPADVYGTGVQFVITFLFPLAISATFPAQTLLHGTTIKGLATMILPTIAFFIISLAAWSYSLRKYSSAGG